MTKILPPRVPCVPHPKPRRWSTRDVGHGPGTHYRVTVWLCDDCGTSWETRKLVPAHYTPLAQPMKPMTFLKTLGLISALPQSREGRCVGPPSTGELRRWLKNGAVVINGQRVTAASDIRWPILELVFFEGSRSQVTMVMDDRLFAPVSPDVFP